MKEKDSKKRLWGKITVFFEQNWENGKYVIENDLNNPNLAKLFNI